MNWHLKNTLNKLQGCVSSLYDTILLGTTPSVPTHRLLWTTSHRWLDQVEHMIQIGHFNSFLRDLETGVRRSNSAPLEWASPTMYPESQRQLAWRWRASSWIKEYRAVLLALMPGGPPGSVFSLCVGQLSLSSLRFSHILPINLLCYWNSFSYFQPKQLS